MNKFLELTTPTALKLNRYVPNPKSKGNGSTAATRISPCGSLKIRYKIRPSPIKFKKLPTTKMQFQTTLGVPFLIKRIPYIIIINLYYNTSLL